MSADGEAFSHSLGQERTYDTTMKIESDALKVTGLVGLEAARELLNAHLVDVGHAVIEGESLLVIPDDANLSDQRDYEWFETVVISLLHERGEAAACGSVHPPR